MTSACRDDVLISRACCLRIEAEIDMPQLP